MTVVVTGAASGIGAAVAALLVRRGERVAALDRDREGLEGLRSELGDECSAHLVDVCDASSVAAAVDLVERERGAVRGLVAAAGILRSGSLAAAADDLVDLLAVNVQGVRNSVAAVAPKMIAHGGGSIVTVASNAASTPRLGMGAYCASKAAASMLTRCFALELAAHSIRCNVVCPGSTDTPMLRAMLDGKDPRVLVDGDGALFRLGIPLGRVGDALDVAHAVAFLLSSDSRHITGQELKVDGGATL